MPPLPHLPITDPNADFIGILGFVITGLLTLFTFNARARAAASALLNIYKFLRAYQTSVSKPAAQSTGGNGERVPNTNGNLVALNAVLTTLRAQETAMDSMKSDLEGRISSVTERGRRDSDTLFGAVHDLRDSDKSFYITMEQHGTDINNLKMETAALRSQMMMLFKNDDDMNRKLDAILHLLNPEGSAAA